MAPPLPFAAALLYGAMDTGLLSMLSVYGVQSGLSAENALALAMAAAAGAIVIQYPLGRLVDRKGARYCLRSCATAAILLLALLPFLVAQPALASLAAFGIGGIIEGFYTIGLIYLALRYRGAQLSAANGCFISCCALGEVAGPAITGGSMDMAGPHGLVLAGILVLAVFALAINKNGPKAAKARASAGVRFA